MNLSQIPCWAKKLDTREYILFHSHTVYSPSQKKISAYGCVLTGCVTNKHKKVITIMIKIGVIFGGKKVIVSGWAAQKESWSASAVPFFNLGDSCLSSFFAINLVFCFVHFAMLYFTNVQKDRGKKNSSNSVDDNSLLNTWHLAGPWRFILYPSTLPNSLCLSKVLRQLVNKIRKRQVKPSVNPPWDRRCWKRTTHFSEV